MREIIFYVGATSLIFSGLCLLWLVYRRYMKGWDDL